MIRLLVGLAAGAVLAVIERLTEDRNDRELAEILQDLEDLRPWSDGTD